VLVQLGLMLEWLSFPYALPDGRVPATGHHFEYRVPAAGVESAKKLQDWHGVPSNEMLNYEIRLNNDLAWTIKNYARNPCDQPRVVSNSNKVN
jgi:carboxymethylenebutenolidase